MSTGTTIYDIAKEAGVSISTVSRVLSGTAPVSEASRRKVEEAITRRGYHPSAIARGMTSKTTNTLGIVLPKLVNPNYAMIFTGASDEAQRTGRSISLFPVQSLETAEYDGAAMLAERSLDGTGSYPPSRICAASCPWPSSATPPRGSPTPPCATT